MKQTARAKLSENFLHHSLNKKWYSSQ